MSSFKRKPRKQGNAKGLHDAIRERLEQNLPIGRDTLAKEFGVATGTVSSAVHHVEGLIKGERTGLAEGRKIGRLEGQKIGWVEGERAGYARGETKGREVGLAEGERIGWAKAIAEQPEPTPEPSPNNGTAVVHVEFKTDNSMLESNGQLRVGRATVNWGPRRVGPDSIIGNCPLDAADDLREAILAAEKRIKKQQKERGCRT